MRKLIPATIVLCALLAACQATAPAPSGPPNVAGVYEGDMTMTMQELGSISFGAEIDVQQSGRTIDVIVILSALGQRFAAGRFVGDISDAGEFTYGEGRRAATLAQCGDQIRSAGTMKFSGETLVWTAVGEFESCSDAQIEGTLKRL